VAIAHESARDHGVGYLVVNQWLAAVEHRYDHCE